MKQLSLTFCPKPARPPLEGPKPEVGMGATQLLGTDRLAFTVVGVLGAKRIQVRRDRAPHQVLTLTLRGSGVWSPSGSGKGESFRLGYREERKGPL